MLIGAILEPFWIQGDPKHGPFRYHFQENCVKAVHRNHAGRVLELTWARFGVENVYSHRSDGDVGESVRENFTRERVQTDIREQRRGESERVRGRDGEGRL